MIKVPEGMEISINVFLKNGEKYLGKDITNQPLGEHEKLVSFWHEGKIRTYPIRQVEYFEFVFPGA